jgi:hypothetical protein
MTKQQIQELDGNSRALSWQAHVARGLQSGLSRAAYARQEGLLYKKLCYHFKKHKLHEAIQCSQRPMVVPLPVSIVSAMSAEIDEPVTLSLCLSRGPYSMEIPSSPLHKRLK